MKRNLAERGMFTSVRLNAAAFRAKLTAPEQQEPAPKALLAVSGSAYKVGHGYILGLPVAAYLTWQGRMLENNGIVPKFSVELSRDGLKQGRDTQLETAIEVVKKL